MANTQNLDLVKPLGTDYALVSVLNSNSDKIDAYAGAVNASLDGLRDGLGILANGNTHAAITSGQYVYVKNHGSLPEGLYKATANIAANGTLSTSNLAADSAGGLNSLNEQIGTLNSKFIIDKYTDMGQNFVQGEQKNVMSVTQHSGYSIISVSFMGTGAYGSWLIPTINGTHISMTNIGTNTANSAGTIIVTWAKDS
jgi:hypothetical protein